ncbi:MAG: sugar phosphate isomerase/epimerase [Planctomycetota bacterium]|nr:sugar phosphate isomerase/epimerase [Planctomycetota bacterium]
MRDAFASYAKLGVVHFMLYQGALKGELAAEPLLASFEHLAGDTDLDVLEITWIKDAATRARAKDLLKQARLTLAFGCQPILLSQKLSINSTDEALTRKSIDEVKKGIAEAAEMGAVGIGILAGPDEGPAKRAAQLDIFVKSTVEICREAKKHGLNVAMEQFDRQPYAKNSLLGPVEECVAAARRVRCEVENFGLMLDLSHLPLLGENSQHSVHGARGFLTHAHMGNCVMKDPKHPAYGDEHPRFGCEGGENDVAELAEYLRALVFTGYLGAKRPILSFEVKPMAAHKEDPRWILAHSKRTLAAAWALA